MIERRDRVDALGAMALVTFSFLMGLNQVLVKLVNAGFSPALQAGLRSVCAVAPVLLFALLTRRRLSVRDGSLGPGLIAGTLFAAEFLLLFNALEYTSVNRASVLFYTMPVWVALGAHFFIPGDSLTPRKVVGLALAVTGVAVALLARAPAAGPDAWIGDLMCLAGALCWAAIAMTVRTSALSRSEPEMQLLYQLTVSGIVLLAVAPFFGPMVREVTGAILGIFAFQVVVVVCVGMLSWFWVLRIYPASDMAAFSFLAPLFGVLAAWVILDEPVTLAIWLALALVGTGIALISWRPKKR